MRFHFPLLLILLGVQCCTNAQSADKPNSIYYELGKNGFVHNIVFDHHLQEIPFGYRVFTGSNLGRNNIAFLVGGGGYYLAGKGNYHLELGADIAYFKNLIESDDQVGAGIVYPDRDLSTIYPSANIGYRHTGPRTLFRIGFSPGIIDSDFIPGGYLSFGFRLGKKHARID